jgi:hypothetical protein
MLNLDLQQSSDTIGDSSVFCIEIVLEILSQYCRRLFLTISNKVNRIVDNIQRDRHKVFQTISEKRQNNRTITSVLYKEGTTTKVTNKPDEVIKQVRQQGEQLFATKGDRPKTRPEWFSKKYPKINSKQEGLTTPITKEEVIAVVTNLSHNKASSYDDISNEMLKYLPPKGIEVLTEILNRSLNLKKIPKGWKHSRIFMIYKGTGSDMDLNNYRPIALLPVQYKVYTAILNKRLTQVIEKLNLIPPEQNGFRKDKDTASNIRTLQKIIDRALVKSLALHVLYIDLTKAYDSVEHWALLDTLGYFGFDISFCKIIESLLANTTADIITGHGPSEEFNIGRGVRQGDTISPTLFILFLSPLIWHIKDMNIGFKIDNIDIPILAFADDLNLIAESGNNLEKGFKVIKGFCEYNNINMNSNKSAYAWNNDTQHVNKFEWKGKEIENLGDRGYYKYLGIHINLLLQWTKQTQISEEKYKNCIDIICRKMYLTTEQKITLINAVAQASLAYRMETIVFDEKWLDQLDKWTVNKLNHATNMKRNVDSNMWYNYRNLTRLTDLNISRYISTIMDRIIGRKETIAHKVEISNLQASHRGDNPKKKLEKERVPQVNTVLNKIKWKLIDVERSTKEITSDILPEPHRTKENIKTIRILNRKGVKLWDQILFQSEEGPVIYDEDYTLEAAGITKTYIAKYNINKLHQAITGNPTPTFVPLLKHINQESALLEDSTPTGNIESIEDIPLIMGKRSVFTDGSMRKQGREEVATSAAFFGYDNPCNKGFATAGEVNICNAELNAIEYAIEVWPQKTPLHIFADSKAAIYCIKSWPKWTTSRKNKSNCKEVLSRIFNKIENKEINVSIDHVYSHMNRLRYEWERQDEYQRKVTTMKEKYGNDMYTIIEGNDIVDKIATVTPGDPSNKYKLYKGTDRFRIIKENNEPIRGDVGREIKETLKRERETKWLATSSNKYLKAAHSQKDTLEASLWPLSDKEDVNKTLSHIRNFKHKLVSGQLPTRKLEHVIAQQRGYKTTNKTQKWNDLYKIKYETDSCFYCANKNIQVTESREHIFESCPNSKRQEYYDIAAKRILKEVNLHLKEKVTELEWWFPVSNKVVTPQAFGSMGVIPVTFKKSLLNLGITQAKCKEILLTTSKTLLEVIQETWKQRCKDFDEWAKKTYQTVHNKPYTTKTIRKKKDTRETSRYQQNRKQNTKRKARTVSNNTSKRQKINQNYNEPIT